MRSIGIGNPRRPPFGRKPIGPGDDFQQMAVSVFEIKAPTAVEMVDLAAPITIEIGIECDAGALDARKRGVEFRFADKERKVLSAELGGIGEVERHPVAGPDRYEMR